MPLQVRPIAVSAAVLCFFALSFIALASGISPFACCKRAIIGAVITYLAISLAIKAINNILTNVVITNWIDKQRDNSGDSKN